MGAMDRLASPTAVAVSFIDCINRGDLDGLVQLMTDDHTVVVPDCVVHPRHFASDDGSIAVLGTTTGSHLGLPDEDEMNLDVIWLADVVDGRVSRWQIAQDTPELRQQTGLSATA